MGALLGARLTECVHGVFKTWSLEIRYWSDSMITLCWIKGSALQWKQFIRNRVNEIQSKTEMSNWSYCPGPQNPADILTRGAKLQDLRKNHLWWSGPEWLQKSESFWPTANVVEDVTLANSELEKRKTFKSITQNTCGLQSENDEPLFDVSKYSDLSKILRITAYIQRFVSSARGNKSQKKHNSLDAEEIQNALLHWIKRTQKEHFGREIRKLQAKQPMPKNSDIKFFNPFLDDYGVLRVGGRLHQAYKDFEQRHPVLLPGNCTFSDRVIKNSHERVAHAGVAETLAEVRDKYWILKGRQRVKYVRNRCMTCKKFNAKPMTQQMAPLPKERVTAAPPFEITGVDFAGPLYVKGTENNTVKSYIALFTCAVTRAVHLELVSDMSTETFLLAFRRFVGRRGLCKVVISDNAKTFKRTESDLKEIWSKLKTESLQEYFGKTGICWKYIVEKGAWWGGLYERMVRSVKTCLKRILGKAFLRFEEMATTLVEVEMILNSRPITFTYSEVTEPTPLTPGHFLVGKRLTSLPPSVDQSTPSTSKRSELLKRYKYRETLMDRFWTIWKRSYIMDLRSTHKVDGPENPVIKEGTVVLFVDDKVPRLLWKMGVITKTYPGRDGKIRACEVRQPNKKTLRRPVQLLCPFELVTEKGI